MMPKQKIYPKPVRIEIIKGRITIVKDRIIIIKPLRRN